MLRATMSIFAPCLRRAIELLDQLLVVEAVHLDPDARLLAVSPPRATSRMRSTMPSRKAERRHEQLAERLRPAEARQIVEEIRDVGGDVRDRP